MSERRTSPSASSSSGIAPACSMSHLTTSTWPFCAAWCSGASPLCEPVWLASVNVDGGSGSPSSAGRGAMSDWRRSRSPLTHELAMRLRSVVGS